MTSALRLRRLGSLCMLAAHWSAPLKGARWAGSLGQEAARRTRHPRLDHVRLEAARITQAPCPCAGTALRAVMSRMSAQRAPPFGNLWRVRCGLTRHPWLILVGRDAALHTHRCGSVQGLALAQELLEGDRKSTRLNSSHIPLS